MTDCLRRATRQNTFSIFIQFLFYFQFIQTWLGFSAQPNGPENLKKSRVIGTTG